MQHIAQPPTYIFFHLRWVFDLKHFSHCFEVTGEPVIEGFLRQFNIKVIGRIHVQQTGCEMRAKIITTTAAAAHDQQ